MSDDSHTAGHILARLIRERVPLWSEQHEPGLWWWTDPDDDYEREVILEARVRRFRPISERQAGLKLGPTIEGYAAGISVRIDLPEMVDSTELRSVLEVLTALSMLPTEEVEGDA